MSDVPTLRATEADYRRRFRNPAFGADLAAIVAARHGLRGPFVRKVEGSSLVFRLSDGDWLKISPPFFGDSFAAEAAATERLQGRLPARIPALRLTGELEDWRYLVSAHVPGAPFRDVAAVLGERDLEGVADELGAFMAAFHAVPPDGFERSFGPWDRYLAAALDGAEALHRSRGNDAAQVADIVRFLAARRDWLEQLGPPALIHADLTAEHVLLEERAGRWRVSGVLDLADAMVGPAELDLIAPLLELFRGRHALQSRLIAATGVALADDRPTALMAIALQHRFMHFHDWFRGEIAAGLTGVAEIAAAVFGPDARTVNTRI